MLATTQPGPIATIPCPHCHLVTPKWQTRCIHCQKQRNGVLTRMDTIPARGDATHQLMRAAALIPCADSYVRGRTA